MEHSNTGAVERFVKAQSAPLSILAAGAILALVIFFPNRPTAAQDSLAVLQESVLPGEGVILPILWGDLGTKLVAAGVIDSQKLVELYQSRGGFPDEYRGRLAGVSNEPIVITKENSGYYLNLLWAFGLANKNPILEDANEMQNPAYKGAGNFASTGGWTLGKGNAMDYYGKHPLVALTSAQQALVDRVSRGIFRPCCGNSAHFPDCNHGMAMLGLLELMAAQGVSEEDMYRYALAANAFWFPETYITLAAYFLERGIDWKDVSPKEVLGARYSSAAGYRDVSAQVKNLPELSRGGSCGA